MPNLNTTATVGVELNTRNVKSKIKETEANVAKLRTALTNAFKIPDNSAEIKRLKKELKGAEQELKLMRASSVNINEELRRMAKSTPRELRQTIKDINNLLNSGAVQRGSQEWSYYVEALAKVKQELKDCTTVQRNFATDGQTGFKRLTSLANQWWGAIDIAVKMYSRISNATAQMRADLESLQSSAANLKALTGLDDESIAWLTEQAKTLSSTMHEMGLSGTSF